MRAAYCQTGPLFLGLRAIPSSVMGPIKKKRRLLFVQNALPFAWHVRLAQGRRRLNNAQIKFGIVFGLHYLCSSLDTLYNRMNDGTE